MLNGFKFLTNERFLVNIDFETVNKIFPTLDLLEDEKALLLIDDSLFINRKQVYLLTNKRIIWNIKTSDIVTSSPSIKKIETGPNHIMVKELDRCSIFINKYGPFNILTIIDKSTTINLTFKNLTNIDTLKIIFIDYLSNYGINFLFSDKQNLTIYKKVEKNLRKLYQNYIGIIFNISAIIIFSLIIIQKYFPFSDYIKNNNNLIIISALLIKLISIFQSNKKSFYSNLTLFIVFTIIFYTEYIIKFQETNINEILFIIYSVLFSIIDFDKFLKITTITLSIAFTSYFIFDSIIKYLV